MFPCIHSIFVLVLHPYYKLNYIKMAWGGPEEQQHERASSNLNAKDWHDKAHQMLERVSQEYWDAGTVVPSGTVTAGDAATDMSECHDCDIPPHPVHPKSRLHAALFTLNSP